MTKDGFQKEKERLGLNEDTWFLDYNVFRALVLGGEGKPGGNDIGNVRNILEACKGMEPFDLVNAMLPEFSQIREGQENFSLKNVSAVKELVLSVLKGRITELQTARN